MKHFINIFVLLLLIGCNILPWFAIEYTNLTSCGYGLIWGLTLPMLGFWIFKLYEDYDY